MTPSGVAVIHLLFNCIGTLIFLTAWCVGNAIFSFSFANAPVTSLRIAILHSGFKLLSTAMLLPMSGLLEKMSGRIVKDKSKGKEERQELLDSRLLTVPAFAVAQAMDVTKTMATLSSASVEGAIGLLRCWSRKGRGGCGAAGAGAGQA